MKIIFSFRPLDSTNSFFLFLQIEKIKICSANGLSACLKTHRPFGSVSYSFQTGKSALFMSRGTCQPESSGYIYGARGIGES